MIPRHQIAMFVEKAGEQFLAHWIEYPLKRSGTRTHLAVFDYVPTLLPRDKVSLGLRESRYDLTLAQAHDWLTSAGYRLVREMA